MTPELGTYNDFSSSETPVLAALNPVHAFYNHLFSALVCANTLVGTTNVKLNGVVQWDHEPSEYLSVVPFHYCSNR